MSLSFLDAVILFVLLEAVTFFTGQVDLLTFHNDVKRIKIKDSGIVKHSDFEIYMRRYMLTLIRVFHRVLYSYCGN